MKAVLLDRYGPPAESLRLGDLPVPVPGDGEVLVKVGAAPINPADLLFIQGLYGFKRELPTVPGFEGAGVVVDAGKGVVSRSLVNRKVAFGIHDVGLGSWAEYTVVPASHCLALPSDVDLVRGSTCIVNPFTAWALLESAERADTGSVVNTAAGSVLGMMIWQLARLKGVKVINVVRRQNHAAELKGAGMEPVLASDSVAFDDELKQVCADHSARLAFDAVGGETTGRVLRALLPDGLVKVYGGLSLKPAVIPLEEILFRSKRVEGFWLADWFRRQNILSRLLAWKRIQPLLGSVFATPVRAVYPLDDFDDALATYSAGMSGGKVILSADTTPTPA